MFGLYRTLLSFMVMAFHLLAIPVIGYYAVFSFFILSGFLMTTVMHKTYGYSASGVGGFAINRFLRLYPAYWLAIAVSLVVILGCGADYVSRYKEDLRLPTSIAEMSANASMVFAAMIPHTVTPRLSPPTWALTVELFYYALIALGASRSLRLTWLWFGVSLSYVIGTFVWQLGWDYRYAAIPAGSLPFSIGALLYFYKADINTLLNKKLPMLGSWQLLVIYFANVGLFAGLAYLFKAKSPTILGQYLSLLITSALIVKLYYAGLPAISRKVDKVIGDYSYPIYLLHWQLGALSSYLIFHKPFLGPSLNSLIAFMLACILVFIVSSLIIYGVDPLIEKLRKYVKARIQRDKDDNDTTVRQSA